MRFALRLVRDVVARKVRGDVGIRRRIPFFLIDAVCNSLESIAHRCEHRVKTETAVGSSELFGMARTHGHGIITECEATLEEIDFPVPLELVVVEGLRWNSEISDYTGREVSLITS